MSHAIETHLAPQTRWRPPLELALLVTLVIGVYFVRIADPPLVGEEPRWACGAREMLLTGDWIVPRQQGQVFPERPPLGSWAMGLVALARGTDVDVVAIRLPSLLAVLLTCLVIYGYSRHFLAPLGALAAGVAYATFGQVLQIGRLGESEALFTFFVGSSLLVWHLGYSRRWPAALVWSAGYGLAALGALVKGPQAPVYFVAVTGVFLVLRRDWAWLVNWRHAVGILVFALLVGAWQIPFYWATDWDAVQATWGGLAGDRFLWRGLLRHVATYPLELVACLLPWSLLLPVYASRRFRDSLAGARPMVVFMATAILTTFPTVLFAALARGRYFMPLYPCFAILIGLVIERVARGEGATLARRCWQGLLLSIGVLAPVGGLLILVASFASLNMLAVLQQPAWFAVVFCGLCFTLALAMVWASWKAEPAQVRAGVLALAALAGLVRVGVGTNMECASSNPLEKNVRLVRESLPAGEELVSFGPVDHRFVYFYQEPIAEHPWPLIREDVAPEVTYFCLTRFPSDSPEWRANGRGRTWQTVPGTLPVEWETVAEIPFERRRKPGPQPVVVIGKITKVAGTVTLSSRSSSGTFARQPAPARALRPRTQQHLLHLRKTGVGE